MILFIFILRGLYIYDSDLFIFFLRIEERIRISCKVSLIDYKELLPDANGVSAIFK